MVTVIFLQNLLQLSITLKEVPIALEGYWKRSHVSADGMEALSVSDSM